MNARLTYWSGQQYSQMLTDFDVIVKRETKRVRITFRQKDGGSSAAASFSLPLDKAQQLGLAIATAAIGEVKPIEFGVDERVAKSAPA
ncbi:MAG: hypothetical protein ACRD5F_13425 [Candidatus Acidiferrales bacterium]